MVTIRPRTESDLDGCTEALRAVYLKDGYPVQGTDDAKTFLTLNATKQAWVAEQDGQILGHVAVSVATEEDLSVRLWLAQHPDAPVAVLERLFVHPEKRGDGVASKLITAATDWAREQQVRLVLFALAKDQGAMRLYKRLDWSEFGKTKYQWNGNQHMEAVCFVSPEAR